MVRLHQWAKLLTEGDYEKVFQQTFGFTDGDKYLGLCLCLNTSSGPVNGTLYISTKMVAIYSKFPLRHSSSPGQPQWIHDRRELGTVEEGSFRDLGGRLPS
ncbi:GEM-like protein 2, partial [Cucurbita argyrosperma subsp. argyrosperma]